MKFMIMFVGEESPMTELPAAERERLIAAHMKFSDELRAEGKFIEGRRLQPTATGARVAIRGGKRVVFDGPFAETREVVGGYAVLECASREEAIKWAKRCQALEVEAFRDLPQISPGLAAGAETYAIEVRQVWEE